MQKLSDIAIGEEYIVKSIDNDEISTKAFGNGLYSWRKDYS